MKRFPVFSKTKKCQQLYTSVEAFFGTSLCDMDTADVILVGGGDGWMLKTIRAYHALKKPFFGLHCGTLGFLMNRCEDRVCDPRGPSLHNMNLRNLEEKDLQLIDVGSIAVDVYTIGGDCIAGCAFNDVTVGGNILDYFHMNIRGKDMQYECEGTGLVVSTPLGSTGYTASLQTPILPLDSTAWNISGIATGSFTSIAVNAQEMQIDISGKSEVLVGLDGYNHVIHNVEKIVLRPGLMSASLAFHPSQDFENRRVQLEKEKLGVI